MALLTGILVVALLGVLVSWLSHASERTDAVGRLVAVVAMAGQSAPFMGQETVVRPPSALPSNGKGRDTTR